MNKQPVVPNPQREARIRELSDYIFMRIMSPDRQGFPRFLAESLLALDDHLKRMDERLDRLAGDGK